MEEQDVAITGVPGFGRRTMTQNRGQFPLRTMPADYLLTLNCYVDGRPKANEIYQWLRGKLNEQLSLSITGAGVSSFDGTWQIEALQSPIHEGDEYVVSRSSCNR
jgi:hypothetical protein